MKCGMAGGDGNPAAITAIHYTLLSEFRRNETLPMRIGDILPSGGVERSAGKSGLPVRPIGRETTSVLTRRSAQTNGEAPDGAGTDATNRSAVRPRSFNA